jgi:hypothetical protein
VRVSLAQEPSKPWLALAHARCSNGEELHHHHRPLLQLILRIPIVTSSACFQLIRRNHSIQGFPGHHLYRSFPSTASAPHSP